MTVGIGGVFVGVFVGGWMEERLDELLGWMSGSAELWLWKWVPCQLK